MPDLHGRCLCGAVTWASDGPVTRNLVCHCESCQRATSSPLTAFIGLAPGSVRWSGEIRHYESSSGTFRGFCPLCGTRLYFRSESWPGEIHIHAATLDRDLAYAPDARVMMRERPVWLDRLDEVPAFDGFHRKPVAPGS